jgi:hypothetical protein
MIYVPAPRPISVQALDPTVRYTGFYFEPVNGERKEIAEFSSNVTGTHQIDSPTTDHDWVLVLEPRK